MKFSGFLLEENPKDIVTGFQSLAGPSCALHFYVLGGPRAGWGPFNAVVKKTAYVWCLNLSFFFLHW